MIHDFVKMQAWKNCPVLLLALVRAKVLLFLRTIPGIIGGLEPNAKKQRMKL
jgi:hypothetical protein